MWKNAKEYKEEKVTRDSITFKVQKLITQRARRRGQRHVEAGTLGAASGQQVPLAT